MNLQCMFRRALRRMRLEMMQEQILHADIERMFWGSRDRIEKGQDTEREVEKGQDTESFLSIKGQKALRFH